MSAPVAPFAVVVAHPDDEILWLSRFVATADRLVFCFGDQYERPKSSAARRQAVAALPLANLIDLALPESGAGFFVDRARPRPTAAGIEITEPSAAARYEANYHRLVAALRPVLDGCREVYTHNPWGEYGHAEHIQVYRAVAALQVEFGYTIWFSNYAGAASWPLARQLGAAPCWTHRRAVQPDAALGRRLMRIYRRHRAWTWTRFHRWPDEETIYGQTPAGTLDIRHPMSGEWLLDVAGLRWWLTPWHAARKRLE